MRRFRPGQRVVLFRLGAEPQEGRVVRVGVPGEWEGSVAVYRRTKRGAWSQRPEWWPFGQIEIPQARANREATRRRAPLPSR